jgi:hypothetical protein
MRLLCRRLVLHAITMEQIKKYITAFLVLTITNLKSQDTLSNHNFFDDYKSGMVMGCILENKTYATIGGVFAQNYDNKMRQTLGFGICADISLNSSSTIIGPRVFFEMTKGIFGYRINLAYYFQNSDEDFRIIPEVYLTLYGRVNFCYGLSLATPYRTINDLGLHRFSLQFNFLK